MKRFNVIALSNYILLMQFLVYFIIIFTGNQYIIYFNCFIGLIGFLVSADLYSKPQKGKVIYLCMCMFLLLSLNNLFVGNSEMKYMLVEIFSYGSTAYLLQNGGIKKKLFWRLFICFSAIVTYRGIFKGFDTGALFFLASQNYITIYLPIVLLPYYVACSEKYEQPSIMPALLMLFLSVISLGRGNLVFSLLFIIATFIKNNIIRKKGKGLSFIFSSIIIFIVIFYFLSDKDFVNQYLYRFVLSAEKGVEEEARYIMWATYSSHIFDSPLNFILGFNIHSLFFGEYHHMHNSFIMLHYYGGILFFISCMFLIIKGLCRIYSDKKYDLFILLLSFFIKSFLDWTFPMAIGSIVLWYTILYPFMSKARSLLKQ